jgi:hypothetical protein
MYLLRRAQVQLAAIHGNHCNADLAADTLPVFSPGQPVLAGMRGLAGKVGGFDPWSRSL